MQWNFWQKPPPKKLSVEIRNVLTSQFQVSAELADKLQSVVKSGQFAGRPVRNIRIFDPSLVSMGPNTVHRYENLAAERKSCLFEGHIERDGAIVLADRRKNASKSQPVGAVAVSSR